MTHLTDTNLALTLAAAHLHALAALTHANTHVHTLPTKWEKCFPLLWSALQTKLKAVTITALNAIPRTITPGIAPHARAASAANAVTVEIVEIAVTAAIASEDVIIPVTIEGMIIVLLLLRRTLVVPELVRKTRICWQ